MHRTVYSLPAIILSIILAETQAENITAACVKTSACSCRTSSYEINLQSLARTDGSPLFIVTAIGQKIVYRWNPCYPFTYPTGAAEGGKCSNVAVCLSNSTYYHNLGTQESAEFITYTDVVYGKSLFLRYTTTDSTKDKNIQQRIDIRLKCGKLKPGELTPVAPAALVPGQYMMVFESALACPQKFVHGLSAGSVLLIIFFTLLAAYLIFGVIYMRFSRNNQGLRLIPNYDFWDTVFNDIKGGMAFTFSCGREGPQTNTSATSYDAM